MSTDWNTDTGRELLLQGNEAIARAGLSCGLAWASGYPGNPSSEIIETLAQWSEPGRLYVEWSVNEKVALEGAAAASMSGLRALTAMKQNGVNVCLDSLTTLALSGTKAGLVLISADDPSAISSSNEQDSRYAAALAHLPMLEPADPQEAYDMVRYAFELSERIRNICLIRSLSRLSHTRANVRLTECLGQPPRPFFDLLGSFDTFPVTGKHEAMYQKLALAQGRFEDCSFNRYEGPETPELLVVACGPSRWYAKEAMEITGLTDKVGLLHLGTTFPLPRNFMLRHLAKSAKILIAEEIDPILETRVKALAGEAGPELGPKFFFGKRSGHLPKVGESSPDALVRALLKIFNRPVKPRYSEYRGRAGRIAEKLVPPREFGFCPGCPHRASYWAIKNALALDDRQGFVSGDIGCYTMGLWPTGFRQVKTVHAMGSGVGLASGFGKLGSFGFDQPVVSVVGDSTFFHAAIPALINAAYNRSALLLIVLDNAATAMTGFQPHPGTGFSPTGQPLSAISIESLCLALGVSVTVVDPYDMAAAEEAIRKEIKRLDTVKVLVFRRDCALVQGRKGGFPYRMEIDEQLCRGEECGCNRYCNRVFRCPGLVWDEEAGRAKIDEVVCVGCGVCTQVCPAGAILKEAAV